MAARSPGPGPSRSPGLTLGLGPGRFSGSRQAALLLQVFVVAAFVVPSDSVLRVIGAAGYPAGIVAVLLFVGWLVTALLGFHDPIHTRHPVRGALGLLWICTLLSYAGMPRYAPNETQRLSADRWLLLLLGVSGVILVAAEHLREPRDVLRVVRTVVWGATFSAVVAMLQFWARWDVKPLLRQLLPGFEVTVENGSYQGRDALMRVSGTAIHPIELGVVAGLLLPLAIWLGLRDRHRPALRRWAPALLIGMCVPMSVSRSAVLAIGVSMAVFVVCLPARRRAWALAGAPVALVAVFASTPGYLRTIANSFGAGTEDPSITNRLDNYPRVVALVRDAPWLGRGGGTFLPADATLILDNQYLKSAIELGLPGLLALVLFFLVPVLAAADLRRRTADPELRSLAAALGGGCLAAAVGAYAFDAFSFAQFASVHAVVIGLIGACWLGVRRSPHWFGEAVTVRPPTATDRRSTPAVAGRPPHPSTPQGARR